MKIFCSIFLTSISLFICSCSYENLLIENTNFQSKINSNSNASRSFSEQQRQQYKLHKFYFDYYSNGQDFYSINDLKNEHLQMLLKTEKRIDNSKLLLDIDNNEKIYFDEINKFVTDKIFLDDFRNYTVNFSFYKLDKNNNKQLDISEFNMFNKEIKIKEMKEFELDKELKIFDYNSDSNLSISEYEDFFIKYLIKKITW